MFKQTIAATLIIATLGLGSAHAAEPEQVASQHGAYGFLGGAAAGALIGGPFGMVAGAAVGALLAENYQERQVLTEQVAGYDRQLQSLDRHLASARAENDALSRQLARRAAADEQQALQTSLAMDVLFRTNSPTVGEETRHQLAELAAALQDMPNLRVRLEGHADRRGTAEQNLALASARAETVKRILIDAGVPAERIETVALGDRHARAERGDADGLALDRRVSIQLTPRAVDNADVRGQEVSAKL